MKNHLLYLLVLLPLPLITSCKEQQEIKNRETVLDQYVAVWNGDSLYKLDKIADQDFRLRMVPDFELQQGIDNLKKEITRTRTYFPDFLIKETERYSAGDSTMVICWTASGTFKNRTNMSDETGMVNVPGFSVIFFNDDKISGEWIAYSDLTWYKQLGFTLVPPGKTEK